MKITMGAAMTPIAVTTNSSMPSVPMVPATSASTSSWVRFRRYSDTTGTKACENAPSPVLRRRKFGILKTRKKASIAGPVPNIRE